MPWYKSGTVSVTQNSNAVIGSGTAFIANSRVGDAFRGPDGGWYEITNIASDTAMSISPAYQGATANGGSYALAPLQGYVKDSADALRALVNQFGGVLAVLGSTGTQDGVRQSLNLTDTAGMPESLTNLYFTENRVRQTLMTGLSVSDVSTVKAGDQLIAAIGKLQGQVTGKEPNITAGNLGQVLRGDKSFINIVGPVLQSNGMPTGALMERGAVGDSEYEKYACGTLICRRVASSAGGVPVNVQRAAIFSSQDLGPDPFPINFVGAPHVSGMAYAPGMLGWVSFIGFATNAAWPKWAIYSPYSSQWANLIVNFFAIGRWY
ncbi:phage tail protein [Pseudomonas viridiflava]|uniref:phage tail protein n=1 Tax=Pseudomonas viridiflava TaxID=33069 RepID=UPI001C3147A4|nr:phage tail protein [Pseudomonas viridiflava]QXG49232.1 phage tail protein [Pseudomonas viridiflava]